MNAPETIPSVWRLAWMLFMQPILLHRKLVALGINPIRPGRFFWRIGGDHRLYMMRLMMAGLLLVVIFHGGMLFSKLPLDWPVNWALPTMYFALSLLVGGVFGLMVDLSFGVVFGVVFCMASGFLLDKSIAVANIGPRIAIQMTMSVGLIVSIGVGRGLSRGESAADLSTGVPLAIISAIIVGMDYGASVGLYFGIIVIVICTLVTLRVPIYFIESVVSFLAWRLQILNSRCTLNYSPVFFHDLSQLPIPFLEQHILSSCMDHPQDVLQTLIACERSHGQQGIYRRVTARLAAQAIETAARSGRFAPVMTLQGQWLPTAESASQGILVFRDVARYIEAARHASTAHQRQKYLNDAHLELDRLHSLLATESKERRAALTPIQPIWQEKLNELRAQADAEAANSVPNPFLTQPLSTASGVEVFVGRDDLIRTLDAILADPNQRNSLALLGPRRCGKSSLLRMLPLKLPDAVPVFFDLQDNPATTPTQFFSAIASRAAEQARRERDLVLPKLAPNPDITTFAQWLEQVDAALGSRRLLLCIDEFERLPDLFPGDHRALLQLMGLFRATVQNRRNIRLLVAGVAPFDELDAIWSDHLINLRELRVEHLDPDSALRLLTRPIPGFNAIPEPVAREVITRTGCQPLLLQLYGSMLVDRLNAEQRTEATPDDLAAVDRAVREEGNAVNHFRNIYDSAPDDARAILLALSDPDAPTPKMSSATRRYLLRRCFITPEGVPRIPVFFDWVQAEHG